MRRTRRATQKAQKDGRSVRRYRGLAGALVLSCLLSASSLAEARTVNFYSMGLGGTSCQKYLLASHDLEPSHFRTLLKEQRTFVSENDAYDEFIRGVVSGVNFASAESGRHPVVRPNPIELIAWVRIWCANHPDATVINTVLSYLQEQYTGSPIGVPSPPAPAIAAGPVVVHQAAPQFVFVIFQKDVAAADMASFLRGFRVAIDDGPNPDGYYKLRLAEPLPPDQLNAMLEAMRGQGQIVSTAVSN